MHSKPYFVFVGCGTRENYVSDLEKRGCLRSEPKQSSRGFVPIKAILAEKSKPLYNREYWTKEESKLMISSHLLGEDDDVHNVQKICKSQVNVLFT